MTVGELKKALERASDDTEIHIEPLGMDVDALFIERAEFVRGRKTDRVILTISRGDEG